MMTFKGWFPSEMTTGGSNDNNESIAQEDATFQQEMGGMGARVPPGRMGRAEDLASVSVDTTTNKGIVNLCA
jgi:hypothetical protein